MPVSHYVPSCVRYPRAGASKNCDSWKPMATSIERRPFGASAVVLFQELFSSTRVSATLLAPTSCCWDVSSTKYFCSLGGLNWLHLADSAGLYYGGATRWGCGGKLGFRTDHAVCSPFDSLCSTRGKLILLGLELAASLFDEMSQDVHVDETICR